jgi:hypothetical protein
VAAERRPTLLPCPAQIFSTTVLAFTFAFGNSIKSLFESVRPGFLCQCSWRARAGAGSELLELQIDRGALCWLSEGRALCVQVLYIFVQVGRRTPGHCAAALCAARCP